MFHFDNNRPIYLQLIEQFELKIISNKLQPGEKLPSVRDLATMAHVNPNTMQRALAELEEAGLIYTERTSGKYVTNDLRHLKAYRNSFAAEKAQQFLSDMQQLGFSSKDALHFLIKKEESAYEPTRMPKFN